MKETHARIWRGADRNKARYGKLCFCHFGPKCGPNSADIPIMAVARELRKHPGPKVKTSDIRACEKKWIDVGSGVFSRTFTNIRQLLITTKQGPSPADVHSRRVWDLNTGRIIDDCVIDDTSDEQIYRQLDEATNIRIELTLKNAVSMFHKKGPTYARYSRNHEYARRLRQGHSVELDFGQAGALT